MKRKSERRMALLAMVLVHALFLQGCGGLLGLVGNLVSSVVPALGGALGGAAQTVSGAGAPQTGGAPPAARPVDLGGN
jgi:hypothetical protein